MKALVALLLVALLTSLAGAGFAGMEPCPACRPDCGGLADACLAALAALVTFGLAAAWSVRLRSSVRPPDSAVFRLERPPRLA